jgi:cytochrome c peroxidase
MELFLGDAGCVRCQTGPLLADEKFNRLGVSADKGRGLGTGQKEDNHNFRTPLLRNVARTGPYMHDGRYNTLGDVLFFYFRGVQCSAIDPPELT